MSQIQEAPERRTYRDGDAPVRTMRGMDEALAARLMNRDEQALAEVIELYGGVVNGMARRVVAEESLAEEVAQDVFVALWRRPGSFDPVRGSLKTFLATLARNKAVDLVRREETVRRTKESLLAECTSLEGNDQFTDQLGTCSELRDALEMLPFAQREVIVLAYFGGRSYRDVATELAIPEGTTKTRMRKGLMRLRSVLSRAGEDEVDD